MKPIKLHSDYITLQQFLKIENFIQSGGESKYFLASEDVYVNHEKETRRGRKLYPKDQIQIHGKEFVLE